MFYLRIQKHKNIKNTVCMKFCTIYESLYIAVCNLLVHNLFYCFSGKVETERDLTSIGK